MIKDKKLKVNKQKPGDACPAQMKLIAIKCPLIQRQAALAAIPMLAVVLVYSINVSLRLFLISAIFSSPPPRHLPMIIPSLLISTLTGIAVTKNIFST